MLVEISVDFRKSMGLDFRFVVSGTVGGGGGSSTGKIVLLNGFFFFVVDDGLAMDFRSFSQFVAPGMVLASDVLGAAFFLRAITYSRERDYNNYCKLIIYSQKKESSLNCD